MKADLSFNMFTVASLGLIEVGVAAHGHQHQEQGCYPVQALVYDLMSVLLSAR